MRALESDPLVRSYANVLDALPSISWLASADGVPSYLSPAWARLTGQDPATYAGPRYWDLVHPDDRERAAAAWSVAVSSGSPYHDEMRLRSAPGPYRRIRSEAAAVRDSEGRIVLWVGSLTETGALRAAELELAERGHFAERLMDANEDCIKVLSLDGRIREISPNGRRALAISDFETVRGAHWPDFWTGDERIAAEAALDAARAGGRGRFVGSYAVEGRERRWDVSATPVLGRDGRPETLLVVSRDVTETVRASEALARSDERFRVLTEALPGVVWSATVDGMVDHATAGPAVLGPGGSAETAESRLGAAWIASAHPDDRERLRDEWRGATRTGDALDTTYRARTGDGPYRWQLARALPQRDATGAIVRWVGVTLDVDDRRRADESREQLFRLVEASDDFIGIADLEGRMTYANAAVRDALEIGSAADALRSSRLDFFAPEDRAFVEREIVPAVVAEGRWVGDFRFRNFRTGRTIPVSYNTFALHDESGRMTGCGAVARDLRDRRRFEIGMRALADAGTAMYGSLDLEATFANVTAAVSRQFATFCSVESLEPGGTLRTLVARHRDPAKQPLLERAVAARFLSADHPATRAVAQNESILMARIAPDWYGRVGLTHDYADCVRALDARSVIAVPIRSQSGRTFGVLTCTIDGDDPRGSYSAEDVRFAEEIAIRAALAFDHARSFERERRIAATLQEASLPGILPAVDHLYLSAEYRPGRSEATIGGDWYDAFPLDDGRVVITIGDVLGKGLIAAVTMGKVRQALRSVALVLADPHAMLAAADRTVRGESGETYATALAGIFDPETDVFTFASAGHPGPVLRHPDGRIEAFDAPGVMLGLRSAGTPQETYTIATSAGSSLVFFTDGVVEATRDIDEGTRRLHRAIADDAVAASENPAHALVEHVLDGGPVSDDIAVLIAEVGPSARFDERLRSSRVRALELGLAGTTETGRAGVVAQQQPGTVITVAARFAELAATRREVRTLLATSHVPAPLVDLAELAAGELVANAIEHGRGTAVTVAVRLRDDAIVIAVTNDGPPFSVPAGDLASSLDRERGRGLGMLEGLGWTLSIESVEPERCTVTATMRHAPFVERRSVERA